MNYFQSPRFSQVALACALSLTLGACGGGGGSGSGSSSSTDSGAGAGNGQSLSRSGKVYLQQGLDNVPVCVDVQGAGTCAANAATATRTGADGSFTIRFQAADDASAQRFLAAPLIAEIPRDKNTCAEACAANAAPATRTASNGGFKFDIEVSGSAATAQGSFAAPLISAIARSGGTYQLSAPAEKSSQINPLTTLVQNHIQRTGASLAEAEQAVARQLGIEVGHIYQYEDQRLATADNARTAALLAQTGLAAGVALQPGGSGDAPDGSPRITSINFKDAANYESYLYQTDGVADSAGQLFWAADYSGLIGGNPRTVDNASVTYASRGATGYSGRAEYRRSQGNPARVQIALANKFTQGSNSRLVTDLKSDAALFEMSMEELDLSNRSMADFVREMQDYEAKSSIPVEHSLFTLDAAALGTAVFPQGARLYRTLKTHFAETPAPAQTPGSYREALGWTGQFNSLPMPAAALGGVLNNYESTLSLFNPGDTNRKFPHLQPIHLQQSINGTAWNAMKAALNIS